MPALNLDELEALARDRLSKTAYDYYASGAHDEVTLARNRTAWSEIELRYHVLVDVSRRELGTAVLDQAVEFPVLVAPTAFHGMAHPDGELATVRAAGRAGTIMILSTLATTSVEEVVEAASGPVWFQLYVYKDRGATRALVERVEAAGCRALVVTVDAPYLGTRERDVRNGFRLPEGLRIENMAAAGRAEVPGGAQESGLASYFASLLDPALTFADIEALASSTKLPVLVKGVVRGDDALRAVEHGARGIVVSNHGGRQLDTAVPTARALAEVVAAVDGRAEILVDGGVRRGTDVLKALALGARAVLVGRPVLWGLAVGGEGGVVDVLETMRRELDLALALSGCASIDRVGPDLLAP